MTDRPLITPETKVGALLDAYPELEAVLIELAPPFRKLKNPVLRRTVARLTSLAQAAKVGRLFVTLTGNKNVIRAEHFRAMKDGAVVANSGHFNVEIDIPALKKLSKKVVRDVRNHVDEYVLKNGMPQDVDIISVNVPENADAGRIRITNLSYVGYKDLFTKEKEGYRIVSWKLDDYVDANPDTDVHAVKEEHISITPIKVRLPHNRQALESMIQNTRF